MTGGKITRTWRSRRARTQWLAEHAGKKRKSRKPSKKRRQTQHRPRDVVLEHDGCRVCYVGGPPEVARLRVIESGQGTPPWPGWSVKG